MSDYTPITGKLRDAMCQWGWTERDGSIMFTTSPIPSSIDAEQTLAISGSDFDRLCDAIDAIHAQLERENAELKAKLDRVTGEQEEHAHTMGESIANELREYALGWDERNRVRCDLTAIADRIDVEHERQLEVLYRDMSDAEYVKLPKDADGVPIHVGDVMEWIDLDGEVTVTCSVDAVGVDCFFAWDKGNRRYAQKCANAYRHHHAPTVEDVLREFYVLAVRGKEAHAEDVDGDVLAEYASKLRLVKEVDA